MASPRIVIDGYNLIHAMPELARLVENDLERARDALVSKLAVFRSGRGVRVTANMRNECSIALFCRATSRKARM